MDEKEPEWIRTMRLQSAKGPTLDKEQSQKRFKKPKFQSVANLNDRISNLVNLLAEDNEQENFNFGRFENFGQKLIAPKIIYCSRTHSQLNQVIDELKKTKFFTDTKIDTVLNFATSTASRNYLCINKTIRNNTGLVINDACNDLITSVDGCPYFNKHKDSAFSDHLKSMASKKILDIEDILKSGSSAQCCPYFSSRYLVPSASLVLSPYNTILDKQAREAYGIDLSNNILIFDEAHNIVDFVKQMNSVQIRSSTENLKLVAECIDSYLHKYGKRLRGSNVSALSQLKIFFDKISNFSKDAPDGSYSVNDFIYRAQIDSFNFCRLLKYVEETKLFTKVYYEKIIQKYLFPLIFQT